MKEKRSVGRPRLADTNLKKNSIIMLMVCLIIVVTLVFLCTTALSNKNLDRLEGAAAAKPVKIKRLNKNSKILIIGDSRMRDICYSINKEDSCLTYGGGRYFPYMVDITRKINSIEYEDLAKKLIDSVVNKYGSINIYVVATINDYYYGLDVAKKGASEALSFANKLKDYNPNANVYVCSLIKMENGKSAHYYNDYVKKQINDRYINLEYLDITPQSIQYTDGVHFKDSTSKEINNVFKQTATANKCKLYITNKKISQSDGNTSTASYRLSCNNTRKITSISINNGAVVTTPSASGMNITGNISNLNKGKNYELKIQDSAGFYYSYRFSPVEEEFLKTLPVGKCPVAPKLDGVLKSGSNIYDTKKVKYTINTANLSSSDLDNLYLVYKAYSTNRIFKYKVNGKIKTEKIGYWFTGYVTPVKSLIKEGNNYVKNIGFNNYYYTALYSGSKLCYTKFIVEDGFEMNNYFRKYNLYNYNVTTNKGLINGYATGVSFTQDDTNVFRSTNNNSVSCKATSMNAKNGSESNKTTTVTIKQGSLTGSFKLKLPNRYWETGYLAHPLSGKNKTLPEVKKITRVDNTIQSNGKKSYGVEIEAEDGAYVYAMDSGTVKIAANGTSEKHNYGNYIQILSKVNGNEYIHSYAHLKNIKVKTNDRVHKGQIIGTVGNTGYKNKPLKKTILFVSLTHVGKQYSEALLLNNFVGRNLSYANVTTNNYNTFQKYISNKDLDKYNLYCVKK